MTIITDINFFDPVFLKTDPEQLPRLVVEVKIFPAPPGYAVVYFLNCGAVCSTHYREEFTKEPNTVTKVIS